ncbi:uncharacterized protein EV422DRAFT_523757 [Fimicolochytrium jonesii]|uniref:uncharacterized protein n=1 Tax=Fimicolochytrium jonesii TaxID=1396493 RepID=UPI0022FDF0E2|nr:uncharacterized protein EV422DRAFT_523757 [Fimicolochytrium jonesii]KAI8822375.1 hypothetical protein EV422DRAFT_523757 [Fimicolochytrium jonesii]
MLRRTLSCNVVYRRRLISSGLVFRPTAFPKLRYSVLSDDSKAEELKEKAPAAGAREKGEAAGLASASLTTPALDNGSISVSAGGGGRMTPEQLAALCEGFSTAIEDAATDKTKHVNNGDQVERETDEGQQSGGKEPSQILKDHAVEVDATNESSPVQEELLDTQRIETEVLPEQAVEEESVREEVEVGQSDKSEVPEFANDVSMEVEATGNVLKKSDVAAREGPQETQRVESEIPSEQVVEEEPRGEEVEVISEVSGSTNNVSLEVDATSDPSKADLSVQEESRETEIIDETENIRPEVVSKQTVEESSLGSATNQGQMENAEIQEMKDMNTPVLPEQLVEEQLGAEGAFTADLSSERKVQSDIARADSEVSAVTANETDAEITRTDAAADTAKRSAEVATNVVEEFEDREVTEEHDVPVAEASAGVGSDDLNVSERGRAGSDTQEKVYEAGIMVDKPAKESNDDVPAEDTVTAEPTEPSASSEAGVPDLASKETTVDIPVDSTTDVASNWAKETSQESSRETVSSSVDGGPNAAGGRELGTNNHKAAGSEGKDEIYEAGIMVDQPPPASKTSSLPEEDSNLSEEPVPIPTPARKPNPAEVPEVKPLRPGEEYKIHTDPIKLAARLKSLTHNGLGEEAYRYLELNSTEVANADVYATVMMAAAREGMEKVVDKCYRRMRAIGLTLPPHGLKALVTSADGVNPADVPTAKRQQRMKNLLRYWSDIPEPNLTYVNVFLATCLKNQNEGGWDHGLELFNASVTGKPMGLTIIPKPGKVAIELMLSMCAARQDEVGFQTALKIWEDVLLLAHEASKDKKFRTWPKDAAFRGGAERYIDSGVLLPLIFCFVRAAHMSDAQKGLDVVEDWLNLPRSATAPIATGVKKIALSRPLMHALLHLTSRIREPELAIRWAEIAWHRGIELDQACFDVLVTLLISTNKLEEAWAFLKKFDGLPFVNESLGRLCVYATSRTTEDNVSWLVRAQEVMDAAEKAGVMPITSAEQARRMRLQDIATYGELYVALGRLDDAWAVFQAKHHDAITITRNKVAKLALNALPRLYLEEHKKTLQHLRTEAGKRLDVKSRIKLVTDIIASSPSDAADLQARYRTLMVMRKLIKVRYAQSTENEQAILEVLETRIEEVLGIWELLYGKVVRDGAKDYAAQIKELWRAKRVRNGQLPEEMRAPFHVHTPFPGTSKQHPARDIRSSGNDHSVYPARDRTGETTGGTRERRPVDHGDESDFSRQRHEEDYTPRDERGVSRQWGDQDYAPQDRRRDDDRERENVDARHTSNHARFERGERPHRGAGRRLDQREPEGRSDRYTDRRRDDESVPKRDDRLDDRPERGTGRPGDEREQVRNPRADFRRESDEGYRVERSARSGRDPDEAYRVERGARSDEREELSNDRRLDDGYDQEKPGRGDTRPERYDDRRRDDGHGQGREGRTARSRDRNTDFRRDDRTEYNDAPRRTARNDSSDGPREERGNPRRDLHSRSSDRPKEYRKGPGRVEENEHNVPKFAARRSLHHKETARVLQTERDARTLRQKTGSDEYDDRDKRPVRRDDRRDERPVRRDDRRDERPVRRDARRREDSGQGHRGQSRED